jgi:hypothetical protein
MSCPDHDLCRAGDACAGRGRAPQRYDRETVQKAAQQWRWQHPNPPQPHTVSEPQER